MSSNLKSKGEEGEEIAVKFLVELGYRILKRNYRYSNKGEVDIVAKDGEYLVFVEVKNRKNLNFGMPEYAITKNKMKQLYKIAAAYQYENKLNEMECRFDVIAILDQPSGNPYVNHIKNAF